MFSLVGLWESGNLDRAGALRAAGGVQRPRALVQAELNIFGFHAWSRAILLSVEPILEQLDFLLEFCWSFIGFVFGLGCFPMKEMQGLRASGLSAQRRGGGVLHFQARAFGMSRDRWPICALNKGQFVSQSGLGSRLV